jgi:hypothetical protein
MVIPGRQVSLLSSRPYPRLSAFSVTDIFSLGWSGGEMPRTNGVLNQSGGG